MSELIPSFDECLPAADAGKNARSELEMAIARIPQDSPEYARLQNLQIVLSSAFAPIVREVAVNSGNSDSVPPAIPHYSRGSLFSVFRFQAE